MRDSAIERELSQLYLDDSRDNSMAAKLVSGLEFRETAREGTQGWREYIAREGV